MWQKKFFNNRKSLKIGFAILFLTFLLVIQNTSITNQSIKDHLTKSSVELEEQYEEITKTISYDVEVRKDEGLKVVVTRVIDGDTFKIIQNQKEETVRVIGIDTPETVHPNKSVECMGKEASMQATKLLEQKKVILTEDKTQGKYDKYGRLLAYVALPDGTDFGEIMLRGGFAYEYTYNIPYDNQDKYKIAQNFAKENGVGLWAEGVCDGFNNTSEIFPLNQSVSTTDCTIKGNVSSNGEKIYHIEGQQYYHKTIINELKGERWFCTEEEAREAGWRKSLK